MQMLSRATVVFLARCLYCPYRMLWGKSLQSLPLPPVALVLLIGLVFVCLRMRPSDCRSLAIRSRHTRASWMSFALGYGPTEYKGPRGSVSPVRTQTEPAREKIHAA